MRIVAVLLAALALFDLGSMALYHWNHRADPLQQNAATWARDHHLGFAVNRLERWMHSKPPSTKAADSLQLRSEITLAPESAPLTTATTAAPSTPTSSTPTGPDATTPATAAPTTTLPDPAPTALAPVVSPALDGEGQWQPIVALKDTPVVWATSIRPLPNYASVVATAAVIDQAKLHAALFNGPLIPGDGPWNNGNKVMDAALPSLVATFNGGFRLEHFKGGYMTEGRTVRAMKNDEATLAIRPDGTATIGVYGKDLVDDGSWVSLRQNLPPVVSDGRSSVDDYPNTYWGDNYHKVVFTYRSAVCTLPDGKLMFVTMGDVDIKLLADALVTMGCRTAMELDINGDWPQFATYTGFGTTDRSGVLLDRRMKNKNRYIKNSEKDFIAFFDPETLPTGVVR